MDIVQASCSCDVLIIIHAILPDVVVGYSYRIRIVVLRIDGVFFKEIEARVRIEVSNVIVHI